MTILPCLLLASAVGGLDPVVPFNARCLDVPRTAQEFRRIAAETGLRRFVVFGPGFGDCMFGPLADGLFGRIGRDLGELRERMKGTDVDVYWWCSPSIRYFSDFQPLVDARGHVSADNKKCPLGLGFAEDWCAKIRAVAEARPRMIFIEDDYAISNGRGLDRIGGCFCPRHLEEVARNFGRPVSASEIEHAFDSRTAANLSLRRAFVKTMRETMVGLARKVRTAVDEVDPTIRICLCDTAFAADRDGDALEAEIRAFAGNTRPAVRPHGAIYGAENTPARIPLAISHAQFVYERLPKDIETFYEADSYPHNRFFSSAANLLSLMTGAVAMGTDDFLFYCLQYLDDPFEEKGYAAAYLALKPRLEVVRDFIRSRQARLEGVRVCWTPDDVSLTRGHQGTDEGHGGQLGDGAYLLAKMSLPYTMRQDSAGPALVTDGLAEVLSDAEIRALFSGGVLVDAPAAAILAERGFAGLLGVDVELFPERPKIVSERICPAAGCRRQGKLMNANYVFPAGTESTVRKFAKLTPRGGTEIWGEFTGPTGEVVTPSVSFATNALGGRVGVVAVSLIGNRSSGLYNLRKQEVLRNLFLRLQPESLPVSAVGVPGFWILANVSSDRREMLVTVNNLSGDRREDVEFAFASEWQGAEALRLGENGALTSAGRITGPWKPSVSFRQMEPEFFLVRKAN